jgi:quercetin dioxygenase-like cupin family protein
LHPHPVKAACLPGGAERDRLVVPPEGEGDCLVVTGPPPSGAAPALRRATAIDATPTSPLPAEAGFESAAARGLNLEPGGPRPARVLVGETVYGPAGVHELHRHDGQAEVLWVREGGGVHLELDAEVPIGPGDLMFVEPGEWHGFRAGPAGSRVLLAFPGVDSADEVPSSLLSR